MDLCVFVLSWSVCIRHRKDWVKPSSFLLEDRIPRTATVAASRFNGDSFAQDQIGQGNCRQFQAREVNRLAGFFDLNANHPIVFIEIQNDSGDDLF